MIQKQQSDIDMWHTYDEGDSIGTEGSECGIITKDEEHEIGARITMEKDGDVAPWTITCGIYGDFMHTSFSSKQEDALTKYEAIKQLLAKILTENDEENRQNLMINVTKL